MRLALQLHPDCASEAVTGIEAEVHSPTPDTLSLRYVVAGAVDRIRVPPLAPPTRADGLWRHTCFEAFLRAPGRGCYYEFNLSPSGRWAAYRFEAYRTGMQEWSSHPPAIEHAASPGSLIVAALLRLPTDPPWRLGLSAVIEEQDGRKSYWALAHPPGKPDFHHPDSFIHELP